MATDNKYDRQLRLWGKHGQMRLSQSNIAVLGAGATATETLKNLVLPGLGCFTVVDSAMVGAQDLGNNFFVTADAVGRPRAEVVTELLLEMNPDDCQGKFRVADPADLVCTEPAFFLEFSLIIATQMSQAPLLRLAKICWDANIPLVVVRSYGFLGYLRLCLPRHAILETKPDTEFYDLRMSAPFPELERFCSMVDLDALTNEAHSHTPYVVLLIKAISLWRASHDGALPKGFKEKGEFKKELMAMGRTHPDGAELNFVEANENAFRAYAAQAIDEDVRAVFDTLPEPPITDFDIVATALREFMQSNDGYPPLTGVIPDMHSDNRSYVALQQIYETKAAADCDAVANLVSSILEAQSRPKDAIPHETIVTACRSAWILKVVATKSLEEELVTGTPMIDPDLVYDMGREELFAQSPLLWFIVLRAAALFEMQTGHAPGVAGTDEGVLSEEATMVWELAQGIVEKAGVTVDQLTKDYAEEIVRQGAAELHNTAAFMGGVASQEVIKVITHMWVPINNTFIFNGIGGTSQAFAF